MKLNADLSLRACSNIHDLDWEDSLSAGVQRLRLECDDDSPPIERVTTVVRFAANSSFSGHVHGGGEEFFVLEGTFSDQHADYPAGYYVRNPVGTGHAPHSDEGCTILVKLWQMQNTDQRQLAINSHDHSLWKATSDGCQELSLFNADYESVSLFKWQKGTHFDKQQFAGGVEYFVLGGNFSDEQGHYPEGSWLRLPADSEQTIQVSKDTLVLRKTGHLINPVPYTEN